MTSHFDKPVGAQSDPVTGDQRVCWEAVKRDYIDRETTVKSVAAMHGISVARLYQVARTEKWPKRSAKAFSAGQPSKQPPASKTQKETLINRFYSVLDQQTAELEQRFSEHAGSLPPSSEAERDARTLSSLTKLLEKLIELEQSSVMDGKNEVGIDPTPTDMDAFREELTAKLEELQQRSAD